MLVLLSAANQIWKRRGEVAIGVAILFAYLWYQKVGEVGYLSAQLAEKPKVVEVERVVTKIVRGKERIVEKEKIVRGEDHVEVIEVERVIYKDPVEESWDTSKEHYETPSVPPPNDYLPRWYVGAGANPFTTDVKPYVRAGATILQHIDLGVGYDTKYGPKDALRAEVGFRF
jgi:hypothetical protein